MERHGAGPQTFFKAVLVVGGQHAVAVAKIPEVADGWSPFDLRFKGDKIAALDRVGQWLESDDADGPRRFDDLDQMGRRAHHTGRIARLHLNLVATGQAIAMFDHRAGVLRAVAHEPDVRNRLRSLIIDAGREGAVLPALKLRRTFDVQGPDRDRQRPERDAQAGSQKAQPVEGGTTAPNAFGSPVGKDRVGASFDEEGDVAREHIVGAQRGVNSEARLVAAQRDVRTDVEIMAEALERKNAPAKQSLNDVKTMIGAADLGIVAAFVGQPEAQSERELIAQFAFERIRLNRIGRVVRFTERRTIAEAQKGSGRNPDALRKKVRCRQQKQHEKSIT